MCGIVGIVGPDVDEPTLDAMLALIGHRGPDELGTYVGEGIGMGVARLSIFDPARGQQPMEDPATGVVVALNGEIFNHAELREALGADHFRTTSDTEVALQAYLRHGMDCLALFNGQFALAIWDPRCRRLFLARDRIGIRPLFHCTVGARLYFASEMKSILSNAEVPRTLDLKALDQVFTFWTPVGTRTAIASIQELPPGHFLTHANGAVTIERWWSWPFPDLTEKSTADFREAKAAFTEKLADATALQLRADVEVGAYLSGGIDSSSIVAMIDRVRSATLKTFSIGFAEPSYDETKYQNVVAAQYQTDHAYLRCEDADIARVFEDVVWHAEVPLFRTAPAPLYRLAGLVRDRGLKVVLTGEGADEILLGYDLFREVKIRRFWSRDPSSPWRGLPFKKLYAYLPQFSNPRFANLALESFRGSVSDASPMYSHTLRWRNNAANKVYYSQDVRDHLAGYDAREELAASLPPEFFRVGDVDRAQYLEMITLLRGYLLSSQGDRMTMANAVEGRYPFLDHTLIEYLSTVPTRFKLRGLKDKHLLRESMEGRLPAEIRSRPKVAYQAPEIRPFIRRDGTWSSVAERHLAPERIRSLGLFDPASCQMLFKKVAGTDLARLGTRDNMMIVQLLSTSIFAERFLTSDASRMAAAHADRQYVKTRIRRHRGHP
jgi:asparagine synthase (glutamine-hydrolysing)